MAWLKRLGWGVAGLALLWLAAWAGVPPLVKWQVQTRLSEALGRAVTIDAIRFEPQRLVLGVDGLRIGGTPLATGTDGGPATTAPPLLQIDRLQVDADLASLWQRAPVLESVKVAGLALRVARTGDGHYDIDDLIARFTPAGDAPAGEPLRFALYNLQLQDARITFDDRPIGRVHEVSALRLDLPFVSNLPAKVEVKVEPRLAFTLGATRFDTGAQATPFARTRAADVKLTMGRLDLAPYLAYLPASLPVRLRSGHLGAELDLRFAAPEKGDPTLSLRGQVKLDGVDLADRAGADLLGWQTLTLGLKDVAPWARQVALSAPAVAYYRIPDVPRSLALVDGLIADYPKDPYFYELKGQILFENGRVQEAVQPYRDALHYRSDSALIRYGLARALLESERRQDLTEAAALLREVVRIEPQNGGAWRFLGIAEGRLGNEGLASLALAEQAVLVGNRKDADLYLRRAEQSIQPGDPDWIRLQDLSRAAADIEPPPPRRR